MEVRASSISSRKIIEEALRRDWKVEYIDPECLVYRITTSEGRSALFKGSTPQSTSWLAGDLAKHKLLSYYFLQNLGIMVPPFMAYDGEDDAARRFLAKNAPIVVKPEDSRKSNGVTVGIETWSGLRRAAKQALQFSEKVVLQRQLEGKSYRLLVIGGKLFAAAYRREPFVQGDGKSTMRKLIEIKNEDLLRGEATTSPLETIDLDRVREFLAEKQLQSIPKAGIEVTVLPIASISAGGEATDVTEEVHPEYIAPIERVAQSLGLVSAGFDVMTPDISKPLAKSGIFPFLEVNHRPGLKMHYYPTAGGKPRDPAVPLLNAVFKMERTIS